MARIRERYAREAAAQASIQRELDERMATDPNHVKNLLLEAATIIYQTTGQEFSAIYQSLYTMIGLSQEQLTAFKNKGEEQLTPAEKADVRAAFQALKACIQILNEGNGS